MELLYQFFSWAIYYFFHSFFADKNIKKRLQSILFKTKQQYRLFYTMVALLTLIGPIITSLHFGLNPLYVTQTWSTIIGVVLVILGLLVLYFSFQHFSPSAFIGLQNEKKELVLHTNGLHRYVRHPLYSGTILLLAGLFFIKPIEAVFVFNVSTWLYLPLGIRLEEHKLLKEFPGYKNYKKKVPALVPFF